MGNYPPPPPGTGYGPTAPTHDAYSAERALQEWAASRGHVIYQQPDIHWYGAWSPFVFLPRFSRLGRELRATYGEASLWVVETFENDTIRQLAGEDRHLCIFLGSPRLAYRGALRSRIGGGGFLSEVGREIDAFVGAKPQIGSILGDPTLESVFEVAAPTREEGNAALTMPLRQLLVSSGYKGILELRAGGLIAMMTERPGFDPHSLEGTLAIVAQLYKAAIQYPHPVTAPPG